MWQDLSPVFHGIEQFFQRIGFFGVWFLPLEPTSQQLLVVQSNQSTGPKAGPSFGPSLSLVYCCGGFPSVIETNSCSQMSWKDDLHDRHVCVAPKLMWSNSSASKLSIETRSVSVEQQKRTTSQQGSTDVKRSIKAEMTMEIAIGIHVTWELAEGYPHKLLCPKS